MPEHDATKDFIELKDSLHIIIERLIKIETKFEMFSNSLEASLSTQKGHETRLTKLESTIEHLADSNSELQKEMKEVNEHMAQQKVKNGALATVVSIGCSIVTAILVGILRG